MTPLVNANGAFYRPAVFGLNPQHAGTLYLGTDSFNDGHSKGLWKTADCGSSWTHISTGRTGVAINGGRNWKFAIEPTNSQGMYINSGYYKPGLFKSTNGGVYWDDITPANSPGFVSSVSMDPNDSQPLLMDWHSNCGAVWSDDNGCFHKSKDGGKTWTEHDNTPPWPGRIKVWMLNGNSCVIANNGVQLTTNGGQSWKSITSDAAGGNSSGNLYQAKNGYWCLGTPNDLLRGKDDGSTWKLVPDTGTWGLYVTDCDTDLYLSTSGGFRTSPANDGLHWTDMPGSPKSFTACTTDYDRDHLLLYASCLRQGLWRMRTH